MIDISYTHHAETRMKQRAIRERDIPLIIDWERRWTTRPGFCSSGMSPEKSISASGRSKS